MGQSLYIKEISSFGILAAAASVLMLPACRAVASLDTKAETKLETEAETAAAKS